MKAGFNIFKNTAISTSVVRYYCNLTEHAKKHNYLAKKKHISIFAALYEQII